MCYNINRPVKVGTVQFHTDARIDQSGVRRNLGLLCIMYELQQNNMYLKESARLTRATEGFNFDLAVGLLHLGIYAKSP